MLSTPTIEQMIAQTQAHLQQIAAESHFSCGGCICWGNWLFPCSSRRDQYIVKHREELSHFAS